MSDSSKVLVAEAKYTPTSLLDIIYEKCGHVGPSSAVLDFYGRIVDFKIPERIYQEKNVEVGSPITIDDHSCPKCDFEKFKIVVIRCAVCGEGICPGDEIALYAKESKALNLSIATRVGEEIVGCLKQGCGPAAALAGRWTENGFEPFDFSKMVIQPW
ncbi:MAG: hypothetical protein HY225_02260 [Candidatus Vogelbacteria bacterium]|nr:hypothetical protein [Candidatus Vogelbacteria bacterium]